MSTKIFFDNVNINGTSNPFISQGGIAVVNVLADNFGTASVSLEMTTKNSKVIANPWVPLDSGTVTEQSILKLDYLPVGSMVRAVITNVDGLTDNIFVDILQ